MKTPRTRTRTTIVGLALTVGLLATACELPATVEKPINPARTVTGLSDLERRQAIMDPSIYATCRSGK